MVLAWDHQLQYESLLFLGHLKRGAESLRDLVRIVGFLGVDVEEITEVATRLCDFVQELGIVLVSETNREEARGDLFLIQNLLHILHALHDILSITAGVLTISKEDNGDIFQLISSLKVLLYVLEDLNEAGAPSRIILGELLLILSVISLSLADVGLGSGIVEQSNKGLMLLEFLDLLGDHPSSLLKSSEGTTGHGSRLI